MVETLNQISEPKKHINSPTYTLKETEIYNKDSSRNFIEISYLLFSCNIIPLPNIKTFESLEWRLS